jgi:hypothetical protein
MGGRYDKSEPTPRFWQLFFIGPQMGIPAINLSYWEVIQQQYVVFGTPNDFNKYSRQKFLFSGR